MGPKLSDPATHEGSLWRQRVTWSTCRLQCPIRHSPWPHPFSGDINDLPKAVKSQACLFAYDCLLYRRIDSQQDHQILLSNINWARTMSRYMGHALQYQKILYYQYPQQVLMLLLLEQPHITTHWLHSIPGSHINPWPEMDNSHQHHHKEGQLHSRFLEQKHLVLHPPPPPPSCRKTAYSISFVHSALEYSTVVWDPYQQNDTDKLENI